MAKSRFTHEQIMTAIDEMHRGLTRKELSRKYGVSTTTLSRWRGKLANTKPIGNSVQVRDRLQLLETENRRLKKKFAELALDYTSLRAALIHEGTKDC